MALSKTQVSQLYVSIFGRASEGEGNSYWQADQSDMTDAANVMLATDAAKSYFGATLNDNQAFIAHIYTNTLGKTIVDDLAGINYWTAQLSAGKSKGEVVAALIGAAQSSANAGKAQQQFNNKVAVSDYTADKIAKFTTDETFKGFIANVNDTDTSVTTAKSDVDDQVPSAGKAFTLTPGDDTVTGTSGDDTITAASGTLTAKDTIIDTNSGDKDVLNLSLARSMAAVNEPKIEKIETINVTLDALAGAVTAFDATNVTGADIVMNAGKAIDASATVVDAGASGASGTQGGRVRSLFVPADNNGSEGGAQ